MCQRVCIIHTHKNAQRHSTHKHTHTHTHTWRQDHVHTSRVFCTHADMTYIHSMSTSRCRQGGRGAINDWVISFSLFRPTSEYPLLSPCKFHQSPRITHFEIENFKNMCLHYVSNFDPKIQDQNEDSVEKGPGCTIFLLSLATAFLPLRTYSMCAAGHKRFLVHDGAIMGDTFIHGAKIPCDNQVCHSDWCSWCTISALLVEEEFDQSILLPSTKSWRVLIIQLGFDKSPGNFNFTILHYRTPIPFSFSWYNKSSQLYSKKILGRRHPNSIRNKAPTIANPTDIPAPHRNMLPIAEPKEGCDCIWYADCLYMLVGFGSPTCIKTSVVQEIVVNRGIYVHVHGICMHECSDAIIPRNILTNIKRNIKRKNDATWHPSAIK